MPRAAQQVQATVKATRERQARSADLACAIMAGGRGERFWPKSRASRPKQFLSIGGRLTLLQATFRRLGRLVGPERMLVVTGADFVDLVRDQLPDLPAENVIAEPVGRDTAPCVGLAALEAARRWGDPVLCVVPADHAIWDEAAFAATIRTAVRAAGCGDPVILGIRPSRPETGYGYIRVGREADAGDGRSRSPVYSVERFVEKPSRRSAAAMLRSGRYLWNCGIFVFRAGAGLAAIAHHLPEVGAGLERLAPHLGTAGFRRAIAEVYPSLPRVSFDRGVLERVRGLKVVPASFPWDDVGSWPALDRLPRAGDGEDDGDNTIQGEAVAVGSRGCIVDAAGGRRLVVLFGVRDLVVVDTDDVLLVASKDSAPEMKQLIARLRDLGHDAYFDGARAKPPAG